MNHQWPYPHYSVPPNVPVICTTAQLLQSSVSIVNANCALQSMVGSQSCASANVVPPASIFTSVPPPSLSKPIQDAKIDFSVPPPNVFLTRNLPSNGISSSELIPNGQHLICSGDTPALLSSSPSPSILTEALPPLPHDSPPPIPSESPPPVPNEPPPPVPNELPPTDSTELPSTVSSPSSSVKTLSISANSSISPNAPAKLLHDSAISPKQLETSFTRTLPPVPVQTSVSNIDQSAVPTVPTIFNQPPPPIQAALHPSGTSFAQAAHFTVKPQHSIGVVPPSILQTTVPPPVRTVPLAMPTTTQVSSLPASSFPVPSIFTVPPPSIGFHQPYMCFPVQTAGNHVPTNIPPSSFVASSIPQENQEINSSWNQTPIKNAFSNEPSFWENSSKNGDEKNNCSSVNKQYYNKDKWRSHFKNNVGDNVKHHLSPKEMSSSTYRNLTSSSQRKNSYRERNDSYHDSNSSHRERRSCSYKETNSSLRERSSSSHRETNSYYKYSSFHSRRSSPSYRESTGSSYKEMSNSSRKKISSSPYRESSSSAHRKRSHSSHNEKHKDWGHSSHRDERNHLYHKDDRCSSSYENYKKSSGNDEKRHSSHKDAKYYSSHGDDKHHSSHKHKRDSHKDETNSSSLTRKKKDENLREKDFYQILEKDENKSDPVANPANDFQLEHKDEKSHPAADSVNCKNIEDKNDSCLSTLNKSQVLQDSSPTSLIEFKKKESDSEQIYSHKRKIKQERGRSPVKAKRAQQKSKERASSKSTEEFKYMKSRHSTYRPSIARDRTRSQSRADKRRNKRRRSITPKNLPCLYNKQYKYIKSTDEMKYYSPKEASEEIIGEPLLKDLHARFKSCLVDRAEKRRALKPKYEPPRRKTKLRKPKPPKTESNSESSSSSEEESSSDEDTAMEELERKKKHPDRLHVELWFNDPKEMNDGPLCRCSAKSRRAGIRHGIYVGEDHLPLCDPYSNNSNRLHHYRITITPTTNFVTNNPTTILHDGHDYRFEGFSMFSHLPLPQLPKCKVIRFNYEYTILYTEEEYPKNFTIQGLELFSQYLLIEILELVDLNWKAHNDPDGCPRFHFMPRFTRELDDGGKEILAHCHVLDYLLKQNQGLINEEKLPNIFSLDDHEWQDVADEVKGMIVTCPGMKPSSIRVDQLDREQCIKTDKDEFPVIVHFGVRPPQLSYAGNPHYQKAWRDYVKYRHLLANKPKVKYFDRHKLAQKESKLQEMRMENDLKRDVTVVISSKDFYKTGIMSDVIQHAMLLPVLVCHLRFHQSLTHLEKKLGYQFQDRFLLQLALTHPSYRENFGTNPDHARNSLTNCGLRQPQYGDRRIHYMNTRKRGINTLINIMSRFGSRKETISRINHNERLEFLGDAVVEFLSSIHLFYMFPDLEEGGLATYRAAIVQNQHLAVLSKKLELDKYMLYAHGSDLCHDLELRHAMANCFEALMGALFLDNGIEIADNVFSRTLFNAETEVELLETWCNFPQHPLQEQEPNGDRYWIETVPLLQKLHKFEETTGIEFNHIRLLARALTHRSLGYNNLTLGSNQRLEFLGDTVLQLVASEYLYKFFPEHHEGHLSLLRSSLVNNRTQAVVCADLGMVEYAIYPYSKVELKPKDKADLLEAFLGALYVDKDLGFCKMFCEVCFFPRLQDFIMNQDWNDPKSKLQQCCLTLRSMDGGEPDIPTYKVIECKGPTNTRVYSVAVYFQNKRLAVGSGHSIQQAEMDAASNALKKSKDLFPQLRHQRRAIERSLKQGPSEKKKRKPPVKGAP